MKIDISQVLCAPDGKPFIGPDQKAITLKDVIGQSLGYSNPNEKPPTWEEALTRRKFADKLYGKESIVDLTAEEIAEVKPLIALSFLPFVVADAIIKLESAKTTTENKK